MDAHNSHHYRPDIDGLRAVAILPVVLYHAFPEHLPGGFVGVDIFFVISGFLITNIIAKAVRNGTFSLADFYARRVRRIFPGLLLVLATCLVLGPIALLPEEMRLLGKHIAAGSLFVANIVYLQESGYFDAAAELKPMLHLWSLGIEEQFYALWPILLLVLLPRLKHPLPAFAAITGVSFLLNVTSISDNPSSAFFMLHTRLWELALGGMLALGPPALSMGSIPKFSTAAPWLGTAAILASLLLIDEATVFPGVWAVLPVAGALLCICGGPNHILNRRILGAPLLVAVGLISYPLYLWHWPILSLTRIMESRAPALDLLWIGLAISVALSWATYVCLEKPIRKLEPRKSAPVLLGMLAATALLAWSSWHLGVPQGHATTTIASKEYRSSKEASSCKKRFSVEGEYCQVFSEPNPIDTALLGDSHAEHLTLGLANALEEHRKGLVHFGQSGCPPLIGIQRMRPGTSDVCDAINAQLLPHVASLPEIKRVVLSFRGILALEGKGFGSVESGTIVQFRRTGAAVSDPKADMIAALSETINLFAASGKDVWWVLDTPELGFPLEQCLGRTPSIRSQVKNPCAVDRRSVNERRKQYIEVVSAVASQHPNLQIIEPMTALCDESYCYGARNGIVYYRDDDHLSKEGSEALSALYPIKETPGISGLSK